MQTTKLTNLELYKIGDDCFLKAEYELKDNHTKQKLTMPKLYLPIGNRLIFETTMDYSAGGVVDFGGMRLRAFVPEGGHAFILETLEEYPQKMTLEEIEKKLGHKIELVSSK